MGNMKIKITKDGAFSLKMEWPLWEVLEKALQKRILEDGLGMEFYLWCLLKEILQKIQLNDSASLKLRRSEFFALFDESTMRWVDEPTQILLREFITPLHKDLLFQQNRQS